MTALIGFYWYGLIIALGIGVATGWWIWGHEPAARPIELGPDDELIDWPQGGPTPPPADPVGMVDEPEDAPPVEAEPEPAVEPLTPAVATAANDVEDAPVDILGPAIAASRPEWEPAPEPEPEFAAAEPELPEPSPPEPEAEEPDDAPDDLMMIKGIGPELETLLRSLGIQRFADIAGWMPEDIERIDGQLGAFKGNILRDEWIGQARLLARGDMESFSQRYGHLS